MKEKNTSIKIQFWPLYNFVIAVPHKMNKMYLSEWKLNLKSYVFMSIDVILLSNNKESYCKTKCQCIY